MHVKNGFLSNDVDDMFGDEFEGKKQNNNVFLLNIWDEILSVDAWTVHTVHELTLRSYQVMGDAQGYIR